MSTMTAVRELPILFTGEMVRAILYGRKTVTRRLVRNPEDGVTTAMVDGVPMVTRDGYTYEPRPCPYGRPGDRLWVRETWQYADWTEEGVPWIRYAAGGAERLCRVDSLEWGERVADIWADLSAPENMAIDGRAADRRWRPSIYMPRWACRTLLEVVDVQLERLHDMAGVDAISEGFPLTPTPLGMAEDEHALSEFQRGWTRMHKPGSRWDDDPWVWVIEFRRIRGGADV